MKLQFLGATETVTGSKYLLTVGDKRVLIDCGLFQGYKELRLRNWDALPVDPQSIDVLILTHAHIDHTGYIPLLVKQGFSGKILCTHATKELCRILLPDSGYLQEEEANYANRKGYSKHHPAMPLYTGDDALISLQSFVGHDFDVDIPIFSDASIRFQRAGHILGAASVLFRAENKSILFSGDIGRPNDPLMLPPSAPPKIDYLVIESTYGDRLHGTDDPIQVLANVITQTAARGGSIIIPAFAVGRSQSILYFLHEISQQKLAPTLPIFLDSPMAINATDIFCRHPKDHRLTAQACSDMFGNVQYTRTVEESKELDGNPMPKIIVSASGMITGGRILHHIKAYASDKRNTIVFCGYQAGGTRGDRMLHGEAEVKMLGQMVPIHAQLVTLENISAHADQAELLTWLAQNPSRPQQCFVTHGEKTAACTLAEKIHEKFGWSCTVPTYLQTIYL